jgi:hypothetical protein
MKIRIGTKEGRKATISTTFIKKGETIFVVKGALTDTRDLFTIQVDKQYHIFPEDLSGRYLLHSCSPNAKIDASMKVIALNDIQINEEIAFDYSSTEDELTFEFQCKCNSENCRGVIVGKNKRAKVRH